MGLMSMCPACGSDWCTNCECVRDEYKKAGEDFAAGRISAGKLAEILRVSNKHGFKQQAHAFCDRDCDGLVAALQELKSMTKNVPARIWTVEYHELASRIHALNRDLLGVEP